MGTSTPALRLREPPANLFPAVLAAAQSRSERIAHASVLQIGCGAVGAVIAKHLCASDAIDSLTVADIDGGAARKVAADTGSPRAVVLHLDASRSEDLRSAMTGCDLVVNACVPRFNRGIKEAALECGVHYMDLATESSNPYDDDEMWKARGLTALLGMGEDPGMSNVFARRGADGMDQVDSIRVRDGDTGSSRDLGFISLFSPESFVEETTTPSRIWRDGAYESVPPFGASEVFEFPPPLGPLTVYSVDHEEVDSLPRFIGKSVRYVDFKLALDELTVQKLREFQALRAQARTPEALSRVRREFVAAIPKPADLAGRIDGYSGILIEVTGTAAGRRKVHTLFTGMGHADASKRYGATATAYLTGTGGGVGALLLATGRVKDAGVLSPECLDPGLVIPMVRERGLDVVEHVWTQPSGA